MPLITKTNIEPDNSDLGTFRWPMMDGAKQVVIRVSSDALQDLAAWDGIDTMTEPRELWDGYREEIEKTASRKYDEQGKPAGELQITADEIRSN